MMESLFNCQVYLKVKSFNSFALVVKIFSYLLWVCEALRYISVLLENKPLTDPCWLTTPVYTGKMNQTDQFNPST